MKTFYAICTAVRIYNSIESPEQFHAVRRNRGDASPIRSVFRWVEGEGWLRIDAAEWAA